MPQVATQNVLTELGRVDPPAAGRLDAEAFLEETFEDLRTNRQRSVSGQSPQKVFNETVHGS